MYFFLNENERVIDSDIKIYTCHTGIQCQTAVTAYFLRKQLHRYFPLQGSMAHSEISIMKSRKA